MWDTVGERYLASLGIAARPGLRQILFPLSLSQCAVYLKESYGLPDSPGDIEAGINGTIRTFIVRRLWQRQGQRNF